MWIVTAIYNGSLAAGASTQARVTKTATNTRYADYRSVGVLYDNTGNIANTKSDYYYVVPN